MSKSLQESSQNYSRMRSFQQMDRTIKKADELLLAEDTAFETKDYRDVNRIRRELREMIDEYYHIKR